jgi:hypothetical protein
MDEATKITAPSLRSTDATLLLKVYAVDHLACVSTDYCPWCVGEDSTVECNAWAVIEGGTYQIVECCRTCLIPVLDSVPYLDDTATIDVEVHRNATNRPF